MDFPHSCRPAYAAANAAMLATVDMLIAVWDGRPGTRKGSTGDVVAAAHQRGLPLTVVWPPGAARTSGTHPLPQLAPTTNL
jgi:hypothetical protein